MKSSVAEHFKEKWPNVNGEMSRKLQPKLKGGMNRHYQWVQVFMEISPEEWKYSSSFMFEDSWRMIVISESVLICENVWEIIEQLIKTLEYI